MKSFIKSVGYALRGIYYAAWERNFRIDIVAATFVIWFSVIYNLTSAEWTAEILIIATVLSSEAVNTAIETLCDRISNENEEKIKRIKDLAAGAVLIKAAAAIAAAIFLFKDSDRLLNALSEFSSPPRMIVLIIFIVLSAIFIFAPERAKARKKEVNKK